MSHRGQRQPSSEQEDLVASPLSEQAKDTEALGRSASAKGRNGRNTNAVRRAPEKLALNTQIGAIGDDSTIIKPKTHSLRSLTSSAHPAWQVIKHVKRRSSTKLTSLVLRLRTDEGVLVLDRHGPSDTFASQHASANDHREAIADSQQNSKYLSKVSIAAVHTVVAHLISTC